MSILHCPKPNGHQYTRVCNSLLDDDRLSHKTVGILVRLLRRKQDWRINPEWLTRQYPKGKGGVTAVRSALAEAKKYGYARLEHCKNPLTGRMTGSEWIIEECPTDKGDHRDTENLSLGKPESRETSLYNNHSGLTNDLREEKKRAYAPEETPPPAGAFLEDAPAPAPPDDVPAEPEPFVAHQMGAGNGTAQLMPIGEEPVPECPTESAHRYRRFGEWTMCCTKCMQHHPALCRCPACVPEQDSSEATSTTPIHPTAPRRWCRECYKIQPVRSNVVGYTCLVCGATKEVKRE